MNKIFKFAQIGFGSFAIGYLFTTFVYLLMKEHPPHQKWVEYIVYMGTGFLIFVTSYKLLIKD